MNGPTQRELDELVRRVLRAACPLRIVLFGSAARGEWASTSDLDLLVIVADGTPRRKTVQRIYREMIGMGRPVDIVVATEGDVTRFGRSPTTVIAPALREGRLIYAA